MMARAGGEAAEEALTGLELEANTVEANTAEASAATDQEAARTTVEVTTVEAATTEVYGFWFVYVWRRGRESEEK